MGSELTIEEDQSTFNDAQLAALDQMGVNTRNLGDIEVFFHQVQKTGLDPFARQIYMIARGGKQTIQTGIDGFRLIARRAADKSGETFGESETQWCGPDGVWRDVWLDFTNPPAAARVVVQRGNGIFPSVATLNEYAAVFTDKKTGQRRLTSMWASKPALMLAKCAEALALRKAFPQDLSGLYTSDEMSQADVQQPQPVHHEQRSQAQPQAPAPIEGEVVASKAQRTKIANLMKQGGVGSAEEAAIAFFALTGRTITGTKDLTPVEIDMLLSSPQKVVEDTKAALAKAKAEATQKEEPEGIAIGLGGEVVS